MEGPRQLLKIVLTMSLQYWPCTVSDKFWVYTVPVTQVERQAMESSNSAYRCQQV